MANTVITSTTNSIKVVFNDDSVKVGIDKGIWSKHHILNFKLNADHISAETGDRIGRWIMSNTTNSINALIVDSVDGVAPSSPSDLFDKLSSLIS